jgi:two-component system sensor histidine kinase UhpB
VTNGRSLPLYWKVFLINGAVLCAATLALVVTPVSVSRRTGVSEALVLMLGLVAMLLTNAALLRSSLAPVDRVVRAMGAVELAEPGTTRLDDVGSHPGASLVAGFNAMLDRLELERSTGNARAIAAQEAERRRIAQELHDEVGQSLTVVLLGLKQVEQRAPAELAEELTLLRETARTGLDDVRRVARELRPGVLEDLGLVSALSALTNDFTSISSASVRRVIGPGLPPLPAEVELVVYRVAQEALTNAHRHAGAGHVDLSLTRVGDRVVLEVSDDGRGCRDLVPGSGVRGMRERALLVGADLAIRSVGHGGTAVRLSVPVVTA